MSRSSPPPPGLRWMYAFMAALYAFVLGLLLYFRFVPYRRVMNRLAEEGVEMPAWFSSVFSVGLLVVAAFLLYRGIISLRKALRPPPFDPK